MSLPPASAPGPDVATSLLARGARFVHTTPRQRAEALEDTAFGLHLSGSEAEGLGEHLRTYRLEPGTTLFAEGDRDAFLALVVAGTLEIRKADSAEHDHVVARLGRGKLVGEMSLIDGAPRSATARALTQAELLVLSRADFERLCEQRPRLALLLLRQVSTAIAQLLRQTTGRMVEHLEH
ncbi:MAG TPA: cyclic nucleotide-binding domain-containing protein [Planctomycetota bacterium]